MKRYKLLKYISNGLFGIGLVLAAIAVYLMFIAPADLPSCGCPIDNNKPLLYVAIGLIVASLVFSFFSGRENKKNIAKDNE